MRTIRIDKELWLTPEDRARLKTALNDIRPTTTDQIERFAETVDLALLVYFSMGRELKSPTTVNKELKAVERKARTYADALAALSPEAVDAVRQGVALELNNRFGSAAAIPARNVSKAAAASAREMADSAKRGINKLVKRPVTAEERLICDLATGYAAIHGERPSHFYSGGKGVFVRIVKAVFDVAKIKPVPRETRLKAVLSRADIAFAPMPNRGRKERKGHV